jgi:hypothetical protein
MKMTNKEKDHNCGDKNKVIKTRRETNTKAATKTAKDQDNYENYETKRKTKTMIMKVTMTMTKSKTKTDTNNDDILKCPQHYVYTMTKHK